MDYDAVIQIRLTGQVAELFRALCKSNRVTVSAVLRREIHGLINRGSIDLCEVQNEDTLTYDTSADS